MSGINPAPDAMDAIAAPPKDREPIVRQELTVSLYWEWYLPSGRHGNWPDPGLAILGQIRRVELKNIVNSVGVKLMIRGYGATNTF